MTRNEHLDWAKRRALDYVKEGDLSSAWASVISDLQKHEETAGHTAIELGTMLMLAGHLSTEAKMRKFIEGLN